MPLIFIAMDDEEKNSLGMLSENCLPLNQVDWSGHIFMKLDSSCVLFVDCWKGESCALVLKSKKLEVW